MPKFTTFDEMFTIVWTEIGSWPSKKRRKYRAIMLKVKRMMDRNVTPGLRYQDKVYDYYKEIFHGNDI